MSEHLILIVDADEKRQKEVSSFFKGENIRFSQETTADGGIDFLKRNEVSLLIVSSALKGVNTFLKQAAMVAPRTLSLMITDLSTLNSLLNGISTGGIFQFITEPLREDKVVKAVGSGLRCLEENCFAAQRDIFEQVNYLKKLKSEGGNEEAFSLGLEDVAVSLGKGWVKTIRNLAR